jgi:hydroxyethylthiazole kinase
VPDDASPARIGEDLERVRRAGPLVHNVTNLVAMSISANVLIAAGASPIMSAAPEEAGDLAAMAGALAVNMGTLTRDWIEGAMAAIAGANRAGRPWVLDPVGVGATAFRNETVAQLLAERPRIVRGNAAAARRPAGIVSGARGAH